LRTRENLYPAQFCATIAYTGRAYRGLSLLAPKAATRDTVGLVFLPLSRKKPAARPVAHKRTLSENLLRSSPEGGRHEHEAGAASFHGELVDATRCGRLDRRLRECMRGGVLAGGTMTPPATAGPSTGRIHSILDNLIRERQRL